MANPSYSSGINAFELEQAYRQSTDDYWLRLSKVSALVGLVIIPAGVTLDYFVYPEQLSKFAVLRLLCDFIIALSLPVYASKLGKPFFREITFFWLLCAQGMICYMILVTEGGASPYYAGLNIAVLAVGIFLPTSVKETAFICAATLLMYLMTVLLYGINESNWQQVYNNFYFLVLVSIVTLFASYFGNQRRFEAFRLNYELDFRNRQMAELDRMKSDFFANISHELRTPLTLILSPVQDLLSRHQHLPDDIAGILGMVRTNAQRLLKLVNDLLDIIRLEEGRGSMEKTPIALDPMLAGLADSMTHLAAMQGTRIEKDLRAADALILGDPAALEKIFINLMNNAIKFTEKGGRIVVSSHAEDDQVTISVADTGIGISSDDLPYVFDRFRQADGSSTRRYQGTGLGLALVKELTEQHDGQVTVTSLLGEGTTMTIEFPVLNPDSPSLDANPEKASVQGTDQTGIQTLHHQAAINAGLHVTADADWETNDLVLQGNQSRPLVLVVDDEQDMRHYIVSTLQDEYRVLQAKDGAEGLKLAQQYKPDLMVLDYMLPEMDGLQVCHLLKQDTATRQIKIILLTARVDEQTKLTALEQGADDFLTKPFSSIEVQTRLRNLMTTAALEQALGERNQELSTTLTDLKQAQSQLVQSEKLNALGNLSAGLLHEVNNPLNYTLTAVQITANAPEIRNNPDLNEMLEDMKEGLGRIKTIVTDLRAFAYPEEAAKQKPFELSHAIEVAQRFTARELNQSVIDIDLAPDTRVKGSESHIVQIFVNLFTNASKAIAQVEPPRQGLIRVSSEPVGNRLKITVSDNGCGMTQEVLDNIFDPFFTTRDVGEGMGMGLSVCHTIMHNHGGQLSASSTPGEGSVFEFDLERAES